MSSKSVKRDHSLRSRITLLAFLTSGFISILAAALVLFVSYRYLISDLDEKIMRLVSDLKEEYAECNGFTPDFVQHMETDAQEHNATMTFVLLTGPTNAVLHATHTPGSFLVRILHELRKGRVSGRFLKERGDSDWGIDRAIRYQSLPLQDGNRITIARDVSEIERYLIFLTAALGGSSLLITILSALVAWTTGTKINHRLSDVERTAAQIAAGDWSHRVPDTSNIREISSLAASFNSMASSNEKTLNELRVLTDNIAHDLRTPLTRLSLAAETEANGGRLREPLSGLVAAETEAMLELINTMLEISQTGALIDRTPREDMDMTAFVRHACELYSAFAEESGITMSLTAPDESIHFSGHKGKLQQMFGNLVENALKFTPGGGRIDITLSVADGNVRIEIADTGCGISKEDLPFVFKRFWRATSSRNLPGNGLGLALVKAIVTSYGGSVTCTSILGEGATFTVTLPTQP